MKHLNGIIACKSREKKKEIQNKLWNSARDIQVVTL